MSVGCGWKSGCGRWGGCGWKSGCGWRSGCDYFPSVLRCVLRYSITRTVHYPASRILT